MNSKSVGTSAADDNDEKEQSDDEELIVAFICTVNLMFDIFHYIHLFYVVPNNFIIMVVSIL